MHCLLVASFERVRARTHLTLLCFLPIAAPTHAAKQPRARFSAILTPTNRLHLSSLRRILLPDCHAKRKPPKTSASTL